MIPDETHDPARTSWVSSATGHPQFPIQNLPFGIFSPKAGAPRGGIAIGESILDLSAAAASGLLDGEAQRAAEGASGATLNELLALPASFRQALRRRLSALLAIGAPQADTVAGWLHRSVDCALHLPAAIGDYTDFYAGIHHAVSVGRQFRPDNPLPPNYKHIPIGYHGRASSIRISGAPVRRPNGQRKLTDQEQPVYGPSMRQDFELELGIWIGPGNDLGSPIPIAEASSHIAGLCLLNDWSARDLQAWEYQPLGPFLAKNFLTTISPWIVTSEALTPFRIPQPGRPAGDPAFLPYLWDPQDQAMGAYAISLEIHLTTAEMRRQGMAPHRIARSPASHLYWTVAQMIAHHTSGGCNLRPGDLLGTGTISTPDDTGRGCLLELTEGGRKALSLVTGETRSFLEDGDEIAITGRAEAHGQVSIGFGECRGLVGPALTSLPSAADPSRPRPADAS